jgi:surface protein
MFAGYGGDMSLKEIIGLEKFNTSNVTNMSTMFQRCVKITSLNLTSFDTNNVTDMSYMFASCSNLKSIRVSSKWKTASTKDYMFYDCGVSKVTVEN